jgi:hypothetical protein
MEIQEQADYTIFSEEPTPYSPKRGLRILRHNLGAYIVRTERGGIFGRQSYPEETFRQYYQEYVDLGEERASHLQKLIQHGINVAPTYFVAGTDSFDYLRLYSLTKEIKGHNLQTYKHLSQDNQPALAQEYNQLITALCSYFAAQFKNDEQAMDDIADLRQYILANNEGCPKIYLIDTDIYLSRPYSNLAKTTITKLTRSAENLGSKFTDGGGQMGQSFSAIKQLESKIL